ncbi:class I SAM-dependent methyltransferase [Nordella sp. HKS 07]|uniref:class I SAM-dependent methyltransferase n=1 Tax=Nordella sp. HKS 07 TaxID=2712222 RepID=UPI0013E1EAFB|nr:class I SAM-dependent methyltransferase [Nordella sp. HKS 07]QIG51351.1 class I SAM-dependent methyltransferase [Nordella sp. HKS 07]
MTDISELFREHFARRLAEHGPTAAGVDWMREEMAHLSYDYALQLVRREHHGTRPTLLDVGCGYGALLSYAQDKGIDLDYTGIDIVPEMIGYARSLHKNGNFICGDFLLMNEMRRYDYVVCNGILTIKLRATTLDMDRYFNALVKKLYDCCNIGTCFNLMTNKVNFQVENSYYRSPVETLAFCMSELSSKVVLNHDHPRYQFWTYVYRND